VHDHLKWLDPYEFFGFGLTFVNKFDKRAIRSTKEIGKTKLKFIHQFNKNNVETTHHKITLFDQLQFGGSS